MANDPFGPEELPLGNNLRGLLRNWLGVRFSANADNIWQHYYWWVVLKLFPYPYPIHPPRQFFFHVICFFFGLCLESIWHVSPPDHWNIFKGNFEGGQCTSSGAEGSSPTIYNLSPLKARDRVVCIRANIGRREKKLSNLPSIKGRLQCRHRMFIT